MSDPRDFDENAHAEMLDGVPKLYARGVQLFNERDFFECHEVLEEMWRHADGPEAEFYQGLIQAAVCLYHWCNGNFDGAMRLAIESLRRLEPLPPVMFRLDLRGFLAEFKPLVQPLLGDKKKLRPLDAGACPILRLLAA